MQFLAPLKDFVKISRTKKSANTCYKLCLFIAKLKSIFLTILNAIEKIATLKISDLKMKFSKVDNTVINGNLMPKYG